MGYKEKRIIEFMWNKIKEECPQINKFCTDRTGQFNKKDICHYNTPIICIYNKYYMQLIETNNSQGWIWKSLDLNPIGFISTKNYFKKQVLNTIKKEKLNKSIFKVLIKMVK